MRFVFLNNNFYSDTKNYKEILKKDLRPYILMVVCYNGLDLGIPFRSHVSHTHSYLPIKGNNAGLDFTKTVIIKEEYIDKIKIPVIREDEFKQIKGKDFTIESKLKKYIEKYKKSFKKLVDGNHHYRDYTLCSFSTLQNYHEELGIEENFSDIMSIRNPMKKK